MTTYKDKLTDSIDDNFFLFVSNLPAPSTSPVEVTEVVSFFIANFSESKYDPENEDAVIEFCQTGPAGNYGASWTIDQIAEEWPGYTIEIENAINEAWEYGS